MKEIVEQGKILEVKSGSFLYGLNTEKSDEDYVGIFFAPKDYIYGLKTVEQVDMSIVSKDERGKNTSEAVDRKFYELKRFIKLAQQGNPNIWEVLFTSEDSIVYISDFGRKLLDNRDLFVSKDIIPKFLGFAKSQEKKLMMRTANLSNLIDAQKYLIRKIEEGFEKITLPEMMGTKEFDELFKETSDKTRFMVGTYGINRNITIKSGVKMLQEIITNSTSRLENVENYGWECKYGHHLLRLLYQTIEVLNTGTLKYPLKDRELLLKVKYGEVSFDEFKKLVDKAYDDLRIAEENTKIPAKPNHKKIEELLMEGYEEWLQYKKK